MERVYNFSAGPSMLPEEVLKKAQEELLCYGNSGMSVMEMSHRSADFEPIIASAEESLRKVMNIPSNYKVLFLQFPHFDRKDLFPIPATSKSGLVPYLNMP